MDKSRPGHQAERLPLIIERPDLAHPIRRVSAVVLTSLAWGLWIVMWLPFIFALGRHFGYDLPKFGFDSHFGLDSFFALLHVMPYLIASVSLILFVGLLREKYRAHIGYESERWRPVGMERLATGAALDVKALAQWQSERVLYVEHGPLGRVTNAATTPAITEA
jgi:poly-beta-1,6-N-acetyl-D-glucosamine biosynthesis protein PgaD